MIPSKAYRRVVLHAGISRVCSLFQPGRVAFLHPGRVGSELLGSLLKACPEIHWTGEFVNKYVHPLLDPPDDIAGRLTGQLAIPLDQALSHRGWRAGRRIQVVKTKRLHFAAAGIDDPQAASRILDRAGMRRRIVLQRRNAVRSIVSWTRALAFNKAHAYRLEEVPSGPAEVPLDAIPTRLGRLPIEEALMLRERDCAWIDAAAGEHALRLVYEDDLRQDPRKSIDAMAAYLGIAPWPATPATVPTGAAPLRQLVLNHDQLATRLSGSRWEAMLYD